MASLRNYGPAAPHGPNMTGEHTATKNAVDDMDPNEAGIFKYLLLPDDSYDENGTYWADLSIAKRAKFVSRVDSAESRRELNNIWANTKKKPWWPFKAYFMNMVLPGAGLLLEG